MKWFIKILFGVVALLGIYWLWAESDKPIVPNPPTKIDYVQSFGSNQGKGNLLGIQPFVLPEHYASALNFENLIENYLKRASDEKLIVPQKTIVVLPEYLGTWLVVTEEKKQVYEAATLNDALLPMVLGNLLSFTKHFITAPSATKNKVNHAVFALKSHQMAADYSRIFSNLAKKYQVYIVAGSILLPNPSIKNNQVVVGEGELFNVTAVFKPDGTLFPELTKKAFPIATEQSFVCAAAIGQNPVYKTSIGRMGVLICADSWYNTAYDNLNSQKADFVVVPSYTAGDGSMAKLWAGYSGATTPVEAKADIGRITEQEAWLKYAMSTRIKTQTNIKKGINVFLRGNLWDLGTDGSTVVVQDSAVVTKNINSGALVNLWL